MMNGLRRIAATLAIGMLAAGFAGAAEKTVKVWSMNRHDAVYVKERIAAFNEAHKGDIKVEYSIYTDNYDQALDLAFAANEAPDLMSSMSYAFPRYVGKGFYEPLNGYLSAEEKNRFDDYFVEGINTFGGNVYTIPTFGSTGRLIYNKGIFERVGIKAPPKTMAELVAYTKLITEKLKGEGIYGFAANLKGPRSSLDRSFEMIVERSGGPRHGFDFRKGEYDFSFDKPIIEAFRTIYAGGYAFPGSAALDIDPLRTQFAAGKIAMYISWSHAEPGVYANQFPTKERWGAAYVPTLDGSAATQPIMAMGGWMINAKSRVKPEAWKVYSELFLEKSFVVGYHEAGLGTTIVPDYIAVAKTPASIKDSPLFALDAKDKLWPATPLDINASAIVVEGKDQWSTIAELFFNAADIDKTLADLTKRYNDAYRKAIAAGKLKEVKYPKFNPADPIKSTR